MKKHSKSLLAAWIVGAAYFIYITTYFWGKLEGTENPFEIIGAGIAFTLVLPHILLVLLAVIFNIVGWAMSKNWAALTGGILYCGAALVFLMYWFFVIPSAILSFVGFAMLKKTQNSPGSLQPDSEEITAGYSRASSLLDRLVPPDSIRETLLPLLCGVVTFVVVLTVLFKLFG